MKTDNQTTQHQKVNPHAPEGIVLIPAFNEESKIASLVSQCKAFLPVVVVDDGSSDATARLAQEAGATVLMHVHNQGKGAALKTGFQYALKKGCRWAITIDADGQHDPREIPLFIQAFTKSQADLIIGQRDFSSMPPVRRLANTLGRFFISRVVGRTIPDNQSGYRLISNRLMESSLQLKEIGFELEVEMIVECILRGNKMEWVPIQTIYQGEKSHIQPVRHLLKFVQVSWQARRLLGRNGAQKTNKRVNSTQKETTGR